MKALNIDYITALINKVESPVLREELLNEIKKIKESTDALIEQAKKNQIEELA